MRAVLGIGLTTPHAMAADRMLATLVPLADRCAGAGWSLWLRAWPSRAAGDAWVVLAALMQRIPRLTAGIVAAFPAATRVSDIEDLLVLDNLSGGRLEVVLAPDAEQEAIGEVCAALRGEALTRLDPGGTPRTFTITPRPARGTITTWVPLAAASLPGSRMAWRLETGDARPAGLVSVESFMQPAATREPRPPRMLPVVDAGPSPSVRDVERLVRYEQETADDR